MALLSSLELHHLLVSFLVLLLSLLFCFIKLRSSKTVPTLPAEWPLVGMFPSVVANLHRFHDYATSLLAAAGSSFVFRGPAMYFFVTCDPTNVRHIFVSNFTNYPKGEEFAAIFDAMGNSFFNADGESWRRQRGRVQHLMSSPQLLAHMARCCRDKLENGLLPFLARMESLTSLDMQDLFTRFTFDMTAMSVFGVDPGLLTADMPPVIVPDAMEAVMDVGFIRNMVPSSCWKLMKCLKIGPERKLAAAQLELHRFVREMMKKWRDGPVHMDMDKEQDKKKVQIVSSYIHDPEYTDDHGKPNAFLYATLINYMFAGRDTVGTTLTWLFYNLIKHPHVVSSIRRELAPIAMHKATTTSGNHMMIFEPEETEPIVYLHAALFESMRLYPPGPIERKTVMTDNILPSGHKVQRGETILISLYSMGRMEGVWGKDCTEYRPERWVKEDGKLLYVPSYKFLAFNAGPRSCLGKHISVEQMKSVVAAMVWNFDFEMVGGHVVEPKPSVVLKMKNGLWAKILKRRIE
ncbi:Cytochrome P450 86B1 [Triticum urartu]|uniref:Cytochrome P450 86B1 n=2 Tax=Triticum urartu TaxID=4572 RepID=M7XKW4_TRIUA|nr:noroxomaritidine synthase 2-like [Triticum urartu]EMS35652.1 Cytochrome P450 86B1 [Triticum urartu]